MLLFAELADHFKSKVEFPAEAVAEIADEQYVRNVADVLYRTETKRAAGILPASETRQDAKGTLVT